MKIKMILVLISVIVAGFAIPAGFSSWQDNLPISVSVKTASEFKDKERKKVIINDDDSDYEESISEVDAIETITEAIYSE